MRISIKARHLPPRLVTGAFILNSGINKLSTDEATAAQIHGFAAGTYPFLKKLKPKDFVRLLSATEITLGTALIIPVVPAALAGAGLAAFAGGLLGADEGFEKFFDFVRFAFRLRAGHAESGGYVGGACGGSRGVSVRRFRLLLGCGCV